MLIGVVCIAMSWVDAISAFWGYVSNDKLAWRVPTMYGGILTWLKQVNSYILTYTANENHLGKILERAVFFPRYSQDVVVVKVCPNS